MFLKVSFMAFTICALLPPFTTADYHKPKYFPPIPYSFYYGVKDDYSGTHFGQNEKSDGKQVQGSYTVQLPDGRLQKVNYIADHNLGYVADVSYQGQAQYPSKVGPPITFYPQKYH